MCDEWPRSEIMIRWSWFESRRAHSVKPVDEAPPRRCRGREAAASRGMDGIRPPTKAQLCDQFVPTFRRRVSQNLLPQSTTTLCRTAL